MTPSDNIFEPHSKKQSVLIRSNHEITLAATGTQWGKSKGGALWIKRQIFEHREQGSNFLLAAPSYKIMNQSMLPYFLHYMKDYGHFAKTDAVFEMNHRRRVYLRTETDPDSIVGIPDLKAGWLDEAGKLRLYFWENYQARAAAQGARTLLTTSPYSRNWIYQQFIKPGKEGLLNQTEINLIQAPSWENPFHELHDPEKRRKMRLKMDPRRFDMLFGGEWGQMAGLVYDCFDEQLNQCEEFRLPNGTVFYGGVDWGHTEAFAFIIRAVTPDSQHYQVSEFYKSGMNILDQLAICKQKMQLWGIKQFWCGHERPENILLFNSHGVPAIGVPEKDIRIGTDLHYELVKSRRYKLFKGKNPHTLDEYETYHYPEVIDLKPDQDAKEQKPVGQFDHCMSANRFVTLKTYRSSVRKPHTPDEDHSPNRAETQADRLRRLTRPVSVRG